MHLRHNSEHVCSTAACPHLRLGESGRAEAVVAIARARDGTTTLNCGTHGTARQVPGVDGSVTRDANGDVTCRNGVVDDGRRSNTMRRLRFSFSFKTKSESTVIHNLLGGFHPFTENPPSTARTCPVT